MIQEFNLIPESFSFIEFRGDSHVSRKKKRMSKLGSVTKKAGSQELIPNISSNFKKNCRYQEGSDLNHSRLFSTLDLTQKNVYCNKSLDV